MNLLRMNPLKKYLLKERLRACLDPAVLAEVLGIKQDQRHGWALVVSLII